jgi:hypothetical protein
VFSQGYQSIVEELWRGAPEIMEVFGRGEKGYKGTSSTVVIL